MSSLTHDSVVIHAWHKASCQTDSRIKVFINYMVKIDEPERLSKRSFKEEK